MPDLTYTVTGVEPAAHGLTPLLHFKIHVTSASPSEIIHSVLLHAQIQIQSPQRSYTPQEKDRLVELFGTPDRWNETLRNRLWGHANTTVARFSGEQDAVLPMTCTYDMNVAATKYFYALEDGDVPLLFLFSGSIFYAAPGGQLQVQQISWDRESAYRMPLPVWQNLMECHFPNSAWLSLHRDVFDRLYAYKRRNGSATWEEAIERLLAERDGEKKGG